MTRFIGIALTNPVEGREQDFNEWYDNQHVPDVLSIPGCVSAQRFKLADTQMPNRPCPYRYLAVYEYDADSAEQAIAAIMAGSGTRPSTDAWARDSFLTMLFEPIGPKIEKKP
jgi:hypothetical protein